MRVLLWIRALLKLNFYNWNRRARLDDYDVVLLVRADVSDFEVGQTWQIVAVHRATGKLEIRLA